MDRDELTVPAEGVDFDDLLRDWRWLVPEEFHPFLISALGDLFLKGEDGRVYWLNSGTGEFAEVAEDAESFVRLLNEPENLAEWFVPNLVGDLIASGKALGPGQCFGYKTPPALGGEIDPENFEPTDLSVHFSILGQLHRQLKDLPPGTPISEVKWQVEDED